MYTFIYTYYIKHVKHYQNTHISLNFYYLICSMMLFHFLLDMYIVAPSHCLCNSALACYPV